MRKKAMILCLLPVLASCTSKSTFNYELYEQALDALLHKTEIDDWSQEKYPLFAIRGVYMPLEQGENRYSVHLVIDQVKTPLYDVRMIIAESNHQQDDAHPCASAGFVSSSPIHLVSNLENVSDLDTTSYYLGLSFYWTTEAEEMNVRIYFSHQQEKESERNELFFRFTNFILKEGTSNGN